MEAYNEEQVIALIVDDDPEDRRLLKEHITQWGMMAETHGSPEKALSRIRDSFYNLILLDVVMNGHSGIDLIPDIEAACPETKIIVLIRYADKETAIRALKTGAFDFLEKPVDFPLLSHIIKRALETQKTEWEYKATCEDLKCSRDELLAHKSRLEQLNRQLIATNKALSVLAKNIEITRQETERSIVVRIRSLILPTLERLQQDPRLARYRGELGVLGSQMEDLTSGLASDIRVPTSLSSSELRIASLVKNGLTTEEISKQLYISPATVKTHRRNIRKKLGISNNGYCLKEYLRTSLGEEAGAYQ
jgi:DNA-binding NarL/FixJ family response regulator